jgi:hypothetical protein
MAAFVAGVIDHVAAPANAEPGHDFTGREGAAAQVEHALRHVHEHGHAVRALLMGGCSSEFIGALREATFGLIRKETRDDYERFRQVLFANVSTAPSVWCQDFCDLHRCWFV